MPSVTEKDNQGHIYENLLRSEADFWSFAERVEADLLGALKSAGSRTKAFGKDAHSTLALLAILRGNDAEAVHRIRLARSLCDREATRLTLHIVGEAILEARKGPVTPEPAETVDCFREIISALPWPTVGAQLKQLRAQLQLLNPAIFEGVVTQHVRPSIAPDAAIERDIAHLLVRMKFNISEVLPLCRDLITVLDSTIDANVKKQAPPRSVAINLGENLELSKTIVGIWDSGVDTGFYSGKMACWSRHSISWELDSSPGQGSLLPIGHENARRYLEMSEHLAGLVDLQLGVSSVGAESFRRRVMELSSLDAVDFLERLNLISNYVHGTHVAGTVLCGNPYARLLSARVTWEHGLSHSLRLTRELVERQVAAYRDTVGFFQSGGARVVNISWNRSPTHLWEEPAQAPDATAQTCPVELDERGFFDAIAAAADVLFVVAAGNGGIDVAEAGLYPASFRLPNVLTVGAIDAVGDDACFTNFGEVVAIYANGCGIESDIPGGRRIALSGTSMAAAQASNLAAKLLSVDPAMDPPSVIRLITTSADISGFSGRRILNPARSLDSLRAMRRGRDEPR